VQRAAAIRAQLLEEGGPKLWRDFMRELREAHLGARPKRRKRTVGAMMQAAYEKMLATQGTAKARGGAV
jgi:hypothetical protein